MNHIMDKLIEPHKNVESSRFGDWQLWLGIVLSAGFVVLLVRDVRWDGLADALSHVNMVMVLIAIASFGLTSLVKAIRWQMLLAVRRVPALSPAFSILSVGLMVNAFVPARFGELVRAYLMGEEENQSKVFVLGTIAVEKIFDLIFLLLSIAVLLSQMTLPEWLTVPAQAMVVIIAIVVPLTVIIVWQAERVLRLVEWIIRFAPFRWREWTLRQIRNAFTSLDVVRTPRLLVSVVFWSALGWVLGASTNWFVALAMGLTLPTWSALLLLVVLQVGVAVPSSPGRVGVFHYLAVLTLAIFSVEKEMALAYAIVLHLVVFGTMALLGIWGLWRERIAWHSLADAVRRVSNLRGNREVDV